MSIQPQPGPIGTLATDLPVDAALAAALHAVQELQGLVLLAICDPQTGMPLVVHQASDPPIAVGPLAAAGASDLLRCASLMAARVSPGSDVSDLVVTLTEHHYVLRPVATSEGGTVVVLLVLSRPDCNLAMAMRALRHLPRALPELAPDGRGSHRRVGP